MRNDRKDKDYTLEMAAEKNDLFGCIQIKSGKHLIVTPEGKIRVQKEDKKKLPH